MNYRFPTGNILPQVNARIEARLGKPVIPGFKKEHAALERGTAMVQLYSHQEWSVHYLSIEHSKPAVMEFMHMGACRLLFLSLNNKCKWQDYISGVHHLQQRQGIILTIPNAQGYCAFPVSKELTRGLFIMMSLPGKAIYPQAGVFNMGLNMQELAQHILYTNYEDPLPFHVEQLRQLMTMADLTAYGTKIRTAYINEDLEQLHELRKYIDLYIHKQLTLKALSMVCTMNSRKMNLGFKELYGLSVNRYIRTERLRLAREAIIHTNKSLKVIAKDSLYSNYANFTTAFKTQFGITPSELRNP